MQAPGDLLEVTLLTRPGCGLCEEARSLLDRLAHEYPLALSVQDIDGPDGLAVVERAGALFVPIVLIGGEPIASGRITERRLRHEFARHLSGAPVAGPRWMERSRAVLRWLARSW